MKSYESEVWWELLVRSQRRALSLKSENSYESEVWWELWVLSPDSELKTKNCPLPDLTSQSNLFAQLLSGVVEVHKTDDCPILYHPIKGSQLMETVTSEEMSDESEAHTQPELKWVPLPSLWYQWPATMYIQVLKSCSFWSESRVQICSCNDRRLLQKDFSSQGRSESQQSYSSRPSQRCKSSPLSLSLSDTLMSVHCRLPSVSAWRWLSEKSLSLMHTKCNIDWNLWTKICVRVTELLAQEFSGIFLLTIVIMVCVVGLDLISHRTHTTSHYTQHNTNTCPLF